MTDDEITAVLDRLVGGLDDEVGDWDEVLERSARPVRAVKESPLRRRRRPWRSRGAVLLGAAVAVTALVVLIVASPWRGGPTILDRAAAAVPAPTSGQILYESIALRFKGHPVTHIHVGLAGASPHRFRVTSAGIPTADVGGRVGGVAGLSYDFSSGDLIPVAFGFRVSQSDVDPAAFIRAALTSGRARLDGKTTIRGRDVVRIRVNSNLYGRSVLIALYFVDAHTYRPVRVVFTPGPRTGASLRGLPPIFIIFLRYGRPGGLSFHYALIYDFVEYRYLAPTAGNRKLTNIHAAHPHAKRSTGSLGLRSGVIAAHWRTSRTFAPVRGRALLADEQLPPKRGRSSRV